MPCLLFIDTSGETATVALGKAGRILNYSTYDDPMQQASLLNTWIGEVFEDTTLRLESLDGICVCAGPGSYTGLRVGLSTAKGLGYSLGKKIMLFDRLSLIAQSSQEKKTPKAVILKARDKEFFFGYFDLEGNAIIQPRHIMQDELNKRCLDIDKKAMVLTDDETLTFGDLSVYFSPAFPIRPEAWLRIATQRASLGKWDNLAYAEPFYLKAAFTTTAKNKLII